MLASRTKPRRFSTGWMAQPSAAFGALHSTRRRSFRFASFRRADGARGCAEVARRGLANPLHGRPRREGNLRGYSRHSRSGLQTLITTSGRTQVLLSNGAANRNFAKAPRLNCRQRAYGLKSGDHSAEMLLDASLNGLSSGGRRSKTWLSDGAAHYFFCATFDMKACFA